MSAYEILEMELGEFLDSEFARKLDFELHPVICRSIPITAMSTYTVWQ